MSSTRPKKVLDRRLRVLDAWVAGQMRPAEGATGDEIRAWYETTEQALLADMASDLPGWWDALTQRLTMTDVGAQLAAGHFSLDLPLSLFLFAGGEPFQRKLAEAARQDGTLAAAAVEALSTVLGSGRPVWAGKAAAVRMIGIDVAIAAWVRLYIYETASGGFADPTFATIDFWAFHLGGPLGKRAPALGWAFVRGLVAAAPDELLDDVGAAELEDFCWAAGRRYIDRIEDEARRDPRFRTALASVWPGGQVTSPGLYDRIRQAAEPATTPAS